jgi:hypothetical protein
MDYIKNKSKIWRIEKVGERLGICDKILNKIQPSGSRSVHVEIEAQR